MRKILALAAFLLVCLGLSAQLQFDIKAFSDSTKYEWQDWRDRAEYRGELLERQQLLHLYEMESNSLGSAMLKSALIPGFGQISSKAGTKGTIILGAELLSLGASIYYYDRSRYYYQKYLNATQIEDIENYYSEAQTPRQYSMLFLALGAVIWGYNLYDVVQTTDEYNAKVWQEIMDKYGKKNVSLGPGGLTVRF